MWACSCLCHKEQETSRLKLWQLLSPETWLVSKYERCWRIEIPFNCHKTQENLNSQVQICSFDVIRKIILMCRLWFNDLHSPIRVLHIFPNRNNYIGMSRKPQCLLCSFCSHHIVFLRKQSCPFDTSVYCKSRPIVPHWCKLCYLENGF